MRKLIFAVSILCATPATAAVTITTIPNAPLVEDYTDLFDVAQGTTIGGGSGTHPGFANEDALGGVHSTSLEPGNYVFSDFIFPNGQQSFDFKTVAPVTISGFNLYLGSDPSGLREFDFIELFGSLDNVTYGSLGSTTISGPSYIAAYGSPGLRVQSTFAAANYQYFRFIAHDRRGFEGGRILELDAIAGTITGGGVPEPAAWGMMLLGFGLMGAAMRRRVATRAHVLA